MNWGVHQKKKTDEKLGWWIIRIITVSHCLLDFDLSQIYEKAPK